MVLVRTPICWILEISHGFNPPCALAPPPVVPSRCRPEAPRDAEADDSPPARRDTPKKTSGLVGG